MRRRPPRATLCPYTTRFRSQAVAAELDLALVHERLQVADGLAHLVALGLRGHVAHVRARGEVTQAAAHVDHVHPRLVGLVHADRKSTRLNSSHANISYAVFF